MLRIVFIIMFFIPISVFAFNWKICQGYINKDKSLTGGGAFSSTTSFTTSTGECSMIGQLEYDKKVFITNSSNELKTESSQGSGKHLDVYAFLSSCNQNAKSQLPMIFQKHYVEIFGKNDKSSPEDIYKEMDNVMKSEPVLARGCRKEG